MENHHGVALARWAEQQHVTCFPIPLRRYLLGPSSLTALQNKVTSQSSCSETELNNAASQPALIHRLNVFFPESVEVLDTSRHPKEECARMRSVCSAECGARTM